MIRKRMLALLVLAAGAAFFDAAPAAGSGVTLQIDLFQGYRAGVTDLPSAPSVVYLPPDRGWSDDVERQRQQIAETLGLEGVSVVSLREVTVASGVTATVRADAGGSELTVSVRPSLGPSNIVELDLRVLGGKEARKELAAASLSGALGKTFILGGRPGSNPLFVAVTAREPAAVSKKVGTWSVGADIQPPHLVHRVEPVYPETLKNQKKTGLVVIQATVTDEGAVSRASVVRHSDPGLDQAALAAVRQWRYEPAMLDGKPVNVYITITVNFMFG
ncbi:MAG TPA: TonB family protein [Thermoanaerobaculia bacterium]|nr:TonB family protein [Thermoanaerobaculia bacterium]